MRLHSFQTSPDVVAGMDRAESGEDGKLTEEPGRKKNHLMYVLHPVKALHPFSTYPDAFLRSSVVTGHSVVSPWWMSPWQGPARMDNWIDFDLALRASSIQ
mmetsp:Transcript_33465/g.51302  ORF Transcript_33465/g.51302 Transcript_33465/m.51302 type:complete len:101 (-) Transcript_33465:6-308(-)